MKTEIFKTVKKAPRLAFELSVAGCFCGGCLLIFGARWLADDFNNKEIAVGLGARPQY